MPPSLSRLEYFNHFRVDTSWLCELCFQLYWLRQAMFATVIVCIVIVVFMELYKN